MNNGNRAGAVRDLLVLRCIEALLREHGFAPTLREIVNKSGYLSTSPITAALASLAQRGYIRRRPGAARAIAVVRGKGSRQLAVEIGLQPRLKSRRKRMKHELELTAGRPEPHQARPASS